MLPKVKFLTAVWGRAYIERFAELALPSFLAPGNLPALAAGSSLEVLIMTRRGDIAEFESHAAFRRLREVCALRFIPIDDLIVGKVYGVTLTLAYTRALLDSGTEMVNTHFVFMNADFVLADGSLRSLLREIAAGRAIVLGPSFRATAEAVEPHLRARIRESDGTLAIPQRDLARLSLPHPHSTTIAKTLTQGFCHSSQPNQFFWQVDANTVLGRYYLVFMLCLRPERVIRNINSYCDYAFIPELCPSGDEAVMGDSDEFFMLELQERDQESFLLRLGRQPEAQIAASLGTWTTAEHRRAAHHDVVFHSAELPPVLGAAKAEASAFVDRIERLLDKPVRHRGHWHWVGAVELFHALRRKLGLSTSPPELAPLPLILMPRAVLGYLMIWAGQWLRHWGIAASDRILGEEPEVTMAHPNWLDYRLLRGTLASLGKIPGARALVVRDAPALIDSGTPQDAALQFATTTQVLDGEAPPSDAAAGTYDEVLICLDGEDYHQLHELVNRCLPLLADPRTGCQVFIRHFGEELPGENFAGPLMHYLEEILEWPPRATEFVFVGGRLKRFNRRWLRRHQFEFANSRARAFLWAGPMAALGMPLTLLTNFLLRDRQPTARFVRYCSSMRFRVGPRAEGAKDRPFSPRRKALPAAAGTGA